MRYREFLGSEGADDVGSESKLNDGGGTKSSLLSAAFAFHLAISSNLDCESIAPGCSFRFSPEIKSTIKRRTLLSKRFPPSVCEDFSGLDSSESSFFLKANTALVSLDSEVPLLAFA